LPRTAQKWRKKFVGFSALYISDGINWKIRISKVASIFTVAALATGETLEIMDRIDSEQNVVIFSDSEILLKEINNTSAMSNIIQMLKDKIGRLELRGVKIQLYWILGLCGVKES
jgi:hypothetical protein